MSTVTARGEIPHRMAKYSDTEIMFVEAEGIRQKEFPSRRPVRLEALIPTHHCVRRVLQGRMVDRRRTSSDIRFPRLRMSQRESFPS